jgi:hypothetical protein
MSDCVTYKPAHQLRSQDEVFTASGVVRKVAGKITGGGFVTVTYYGGYTAKYSVNQNMKVKGGGYGRTNLPDYMKIPLAAR